MLDPVWQQSRPDLCLVRNKAERTWSLDAVLRLMPEPRTHLTCIENVIYDLLPIIPQVRKHNQNRVGWLFLN